MDGVFDLLLPQRCLVCDRSGAALCTACLGDLPRLGPPLCDRCGAPTAWPVRRCQECAGRRLAFARARAAVPYTLAVRRIVAAWKERGLRNLSRPAASLTAAVLERPAAAAVTFVPPDGDRSLWRGHHPAERLAGELARRWELPLAPLLGRTRTLGRQRGLDHAARRRNVAGAFEPLGRAPPRLVLVDDVYTTGATVNAAASALRRAGARRIEVVTFARTIREGIG
ncbi:MAG: hypothetical protein QOE36_92 [Gaiellaceae bacterium]|nr:hypothetical protein [Gaiellaceae bacterium]